MPSTAQRKLDKTKLHPEKRFTKRGMEVKWVKNPNQDGVTKFKSNKEDMRAFHESMKKYNLTKLPGFDIPLKDVEVNLDGDINTHAVVTWKDAKGRSQRAYTQEFADRNAEKKWQTAAKFNQNVIKSIKTKSKRLLKEGNEKEKQAAAIINIIANTGLRIGSMEGYKFTQNRGVSTLYPSDVSVKGNKVYFDFKGKSHKQNTAVINDKELAGYIKDLKKEKEGEKFLFDKADRSYVDKVFKKNLKFSFKLKDMRTYTACATAKDILFKDFDEIKDKIDKLKDKKKKKTIVLKKIAQTCKDVAEVLNNTPAMAKKSYIAPQIFDAYIMKLAMVLADFKKAVENEIKKKEIISLDEIFKMFPPTDKKIKINEDEEDDEYPLPNWITDEDYNKYF